MISLVILGLSICLILGLAGYLVAVYNGLIVLKNNIEKAWANIDVLLKQRHDEVPKLVKTCEGYLQYERDAISKVIELRSNAQCAQGVAAKAAKEAELSAGLRRIFALAEAYPNLKAQASFQQLQGRISDLESQIADRREFHNESVNNYNIRIQSLPDSFVASFMSLMPREMFKIMPTDRQDAGMNFNQPA
ncbi:MAG TPA: LemA family protein [Elusimicrobia bacterium]|nr:LemA family protein [Elusimicrobiota bacterium]HBT62397.1 LemA family protein [Elusimicrobiota bacterium]